MKLACVAGGATLAVVKTYGQYCPIARTSELLSERWTPLIVRNLLTGCRTFTEIRAGLPGIPPALLTQRLKLLERHAIVRRIPKTAGRGWEFELTERGVELKQVCDAMGTWGARWLDVEPQHVDADYVLWATSKLAETVNLPGERVVIRFELKDGPRKRLWMILQDRPEVCSTAPGFTEDLVVKTDSRCLIDVNLQRTTIPEARRSGRMTIEGPPRLARAFSQWFRPSPFAHVATARDRSPTAASGSSRRPPGSPSRS